MLTWADDTARRLEALYTLKAPSDPVRTSPVLLTALTRYRERPLPEGFRVETLRLQGGVFRRVALAGGAGPLLVIAPGLYSSVNEQLFRDVAARAHEAGRAVALVEDRFAWPTLKLNGASPPQVAQLPAELDDVIRQLPSGGGVDVLAFSAGASAALFLRAPVRRMCVWSAAFDPQAVVAEASRHALVRMYFRRVHVKAFRRAGLAPPKWDAFAQALGPAPERARLTSSPLTVIHAEDDPVAPVDAVRTLPFGSGQALCLLPHGGHLGFAALLGSDGYEAPLTE